MAGAPALLLSEKSSAVETLPSCMLKCGHSLSLRNSLKVLYFENLEMPLVASCEVKRRKVTYKIERARMGGALTPRYVAAVWGGGRL
jgi:hypothetical protein